MDAAFIRYSTARHKVDEIATRRHDGMGAAELARDPEKWEPVFGKDHAQDNNLERDDDSKKNHPALVPRTRSSRTPCGKCDRELRVQKGH
jgi:hypothetical protein